MKFCSKCGTTLVTGLFILNVGLEIGCPNCDVSQIQDSMTYGQSPSSQIIAQSTFTSANFSASPSLGPEDNYGELADANR